MQDDVATIFVENDRDSYDKPTAGAWFKCLSPNTLFGHDYNLMLFNEAHCT